MNWEAIGAVGEILGALAVVVSLGYVAIQIRQNTTEARIQRTQNLISANSELNAQIANNAELAKIVQAGLLDYNQLSEDDQFRFGTLFFSIFNQYDFAYHQFLTDQLEGKFWKKMDYEMPLFLSLDGGHAWWDKDKSRFSSDFVAYMDARIADFVMPDVVPTLGRQPEIRID